MPFKSCVSVEKSFAKINIFLKIVGKTRDNTYHLLHSRFLKVESLYDTLGFDFGAERFDIIGECNCALQNNTIYKAYIALLKRISSTKQKALNTLRVYVDKRIPSGGGLGGGSSNAACFLMAVNKLLDLKLNDAVLMEIGAKVGSDVPFFLSGFKIADIQGRGEIITESKEASFDVEIIAPKIHCNTQEVFKEFAKSFYTEQKALEIKAQNWLEKSNDEILRKSALEINDLLKPALKLYPELQDFMQDSLFLSGSGSCFWRKVGE